MKHTRNFLILVFAFSTFLWAVRWVLYFCGPNPVADVTDTKMKFLLFICALSFIFVDVYSASYGVRDRDCRNDGKVIPHGVTTTLPGCIHATCHNGDLLMMECGLVGVRCKNYTMSQDLSKPYPKCCIRIKCL